MIRQNHALRRVHKRDLQIRKKPISNPYASFDQLDGSHPMQEEVPASCVLYSARKLNFGKIGYFNFALAKEMGLLPKNHRHELTPELEKKILDTFSIRIINEYDQLHGITYPAEHMKPGQYMATRYLQLQHKNKKGKTSGDGRSIWNGHVVHDGAIWDVSSRGTGVTCLAPGAVEAGRPLQTGQEDFGYGCGLADTDELYGTAIMSEIFHRHGIHTERVLAVIELGKGAGIGVRAGKNLLRPAHLFTYLKQGDVKNLKKCLDYFLKRERKSGGYDKFLENLTEEFARFAGRLDADYIFTWMDWDGDNILMPPGIIDYGSIRQFGLRHDEYRYDDVDRFSSNLNEQRIRARRIVQAFIQLVDFVKSGKKKSFEEFQEHDLLKSYDQSFDEARTDRLLYHLGFVDSERKRLMRWQKSKVDRFLEIFRFYESAKTCRKPHRVADGVHQPAIFNMRKFLRWMPLEISRQLRKQKSFSPVESKKLFLKILAKSATGRDRQMLPVHAARMTDLQNSYLELLECLASHPDELRRLVERVSMRSQVINRSDRVTGNAVAVLADKVACAIRSGLTHNEAQQIIEDFIKSQDLLPESGQVQYDKILESHSPESRRILKSLFRAAQAHGEDI